MKGNKEKHGDLADKIFAFKDICRQVGLKITPQRLAIYVQLVQSKVHPSADTLCQMVRNTYPNISLDTVNRTLITFAKIGLAFVVEGTGDVRRYDGGNDDHEHFKCLRCKRIIDLDLDLAQQVTVPEEISKKYRLLRKGVYFEGFCDNCIKQQL